MARRRLLVASLVVNGLLTIVAISWLVWITTAPRHWFAGAYAAEGPQGDKGPRGDPGPEGPSGPVGPDASDAISSLETDVSDLSDRVDMLESDLSDLQNESGGSTLETDLEDVQQKVNDICDGFLQYSGAFEEIYALAC